MYLSTDYRHFNKGKQAEVEDRVKHWKDTSDLRKAKGFGLEE